MSPADELDAICAQYALSPVVKNRIALVAATLRQCESEAVAYVDYDFLEDHVVACDATKQRRGADDLPLYVSPPDAVRAKQDVEVLLSRLTEIGDYAHDRSAGPATPDALWEIREMAYSAADALAPSPAP